MHGGQRRIPEVEKANRKLVMTIPWSSVQDWTLQTNDAMTLSVGKTSEKSVELELLKDTTIGAKDSAIRL